MSKRFELINFLNAHDNFKDNKNNKKLDSFDVVELLNHYDKLQTLLVGKDQRISELEAQLANSIRPKFKIGQEIWYIYGKNIKSFTISKIEIEIRINPLITYSSPYIYQYEENCFATLEEAEAKLNKLRGK